MTDNQDRVVTHLHNQVNELKAKLEWAEKDRVRNSTRREEAEREVARLMTRPHAITDLHVPVVAPLANGGWGVFCIGCSENDPGFVFPCQAPDGIQRAEFPDAPILVPFTMPPPMPLELHEVSFHADRKETSPHTGLTALMDSLTEAVPPGTVDDDAAWGPGAGG